MKISWLVALAALSFAAPSVALADDDPGALCDSLAGNPDDPDLTSSPGVAIDEIDPAAAEPACRAAIAKYPQVARYAFELGRVLEVKGDTDAAIAAYTEAAGKGSVAALLNLGFLYENGDEVDQDYQKAAGYYRKAADLGSVNAMGYLAYLYDFGLLGDNGAVEARKLYEKQIEVGNADDARINLAVLLEGGRPGVPADLDRAEALLRQATTNSDAGLAAEAKNGLAFFLADHHKNLAEAEALISAAIAGVTEDGVTRANYLDTRSWVRHAAGRDAEAVADAEAAVAMDPDATEYVNRLGDIYAALGRKDDARAAWQKALTLPPPNPYYEPSWDPAAIQKKIDAAK